ncbi:MAG: [FeFe] hydrogenase H-cluster radical SAM maturase HydE, partial [Anaerococcus sp.]|nr:[FeFe] hydrogenase H-cluster radical SAM maturase HydE [Anaerococcus sp.]
LSMGEKSCESYKRFYEAGADRYLLREETSDREHYNKLHPSFMSFDNRRESLWQLKEIGYQVGGGFMVDSPYQSTENLIEDLRFLQELEPDMIGIGPYLTSKDTPFSNFPDGSFKKTLRLVSILRILFPYALIPATTALGTINPLGREMGLKAGANVLMPNLSPIMYRKDYQLYDNKICTGDEAAECKACLSLRVDKSGYKIVCDKGDVITRQKDF